MAYCTVRPTGLRTANPFSYSADSHVAKPKTSFSETMKVNRPLSSPTFNRLCKATDSIWHSSDSYWQSRHKQNPFTKQISQSCDKQRNGRPTVSLHNAFARRPPYSRAICILHFPLSISGSCMHIAQGMCRTREFNLQNVWIRSRVTTPHSHPVHNPFNFLMNQGSETSALEAGNL